MCQCNGSIFSIRMNWQEIKVLICKGKAHTWTQGVRWVSRCTAECWEFEPNQTSLHKSNTVILPPDLSNLLIIQTNLVLWRWFKKSGFYCVVHYFAICHTTDYTKTTLVTTQGSCGFKTSINSWTYLPVRSPDESQCWSKGRQSKEDWKIYLEHTFWKKKNFQIILQKKYFFKC